MKLVIANFNENYLKTLKTHDDYVVAAAGLANQLYQFDEYSGYTRQDLFPICLRELVNKAQRQHFNNYNTRPCRGTVASDDQMYSDRTMGVLHYVISMRGVLSAYPVLESLFESEPDLQEAVNAAADITTCRYSAFLLA